MSKKLIGIMLMIASIYLMTLPYGVPMTFASGPAETAIYYFSYFSMMPFGYGNWIPFITIFLSVGVTIMLLLKRNLYKMISICLILSIFGNPFSWLIFSSFSLISLAIVILHLIILVVLSKSNSNE